MIVEGIVIYFKMKQLSLIKEKLVKKSWLLPVSFFLFLFACSDYESQQAIVNNHSLTNPTTIKIDNLTTLEDVLSRYQYNVEHWEKGISSVPLLTFSGFTQQWATLMNKKPVAQKKSTFFRLMLPLILISNEQILAERQRIEQSELSSSDLINLALKYRIIKTSVTALTEAQKIRLLTRVNIIPPSLALAQAAEESGWGSSRFTLEGNAFFGQWDFSGNGMKPKQQREGLGNYGVARFTTPLASVYGYMLNINTSQAYEHLREVRATMSAQATPLSGRILAESLINYSERGRAYVTSLHHLIDYNLLHYTDRAFLADNKPLYLVF